MSGPGPLQRVLNARALFNGRLLVGHHSSLDHGRMNWALPGGGVASSPELRTLGRFEIIAAPDVTDFPKKKD